MSVTADEEDGSGPVPGERLLHSWRAWLPFAAVIVVLLVGASVVVSLNTGGSAPQSESCPPAGDWPAVGTGPPGFTDDNVSVFVGGDLSTERAATASEGLAVVLGDVSLATAGGAGVTVVGSTAVGSGVSPSPGTTMLAIGGSLSIGRDAALELGHGVRGGGNLVVGGEVAPGVSVTTNGGAVHERAGASAVGEFRRFGERIADQARVLAGLAPTGTVTLAGRSLYFAGDGRALRQVFVVDAPVIGRARLIDFSGIPDAATIVVTVRGEQVGIGTGQVQDKGVRVAPGPGAARLATQTLWNFVDARAVSIMGTAPMLGSLVAPQGRVALGIPTLGRVYAAGDLSLSGDAVPHYNYAWTGSAAFTCQPVRESVQ